MGLNGKTSVNVIVSKSLHFTHPLSKFLMEGLVHFKIVRHREEERAEMPSNLYESYVLMERTSNLENADNLRTCMSRLFTILAEGPNGKQKISIGSGILCWSCGHVGLPLNMEELNTEGSENKKAICSNCNDGNNYNYIQGVQPTGETIPFIEAQSGSVPVV